MRGPVRDIDTLLRIYPILRDHYQPARKWRALAKALNNMEGELSGTSAFEELRLVADYICTHQLGKQGPPRKYARDWLICAFIPIYREQIGKEPDVPYWDAHADKYQSYFLEFIQPYLERVEPDLTATGLAQAIQKISDPKVGFKGIKAAS